MQLPAFGSNFFDEAVPFTLGLENEFGQFPQDAFTAGSLGDIVGGCFSLAFAVGGGNGEADPPHDAKVDDFIADVADFIFLQVQFGQEFLVFGDFVFSGIEPFDPDVFAPGFGGFGFAGNDGDFDVAAVHQAVSAKAVIMREGPVTVAFRVIEYIGRG